PTLKASPNAARNVVFLYPPMSCRTITRRRAHLRPPSREDVNDIVYGAPSPRVLDVATQTRPSGVTCGSDPFSPIPGVCCRICLGRDQFVCVPLRRASAYETYTRSPWSPVPIAHDTYTRPKRRLRGFMSTASHCLSNTDEPLNGVRATMSCVPLCITFHDAGVT